MPVKPNFTEVALNGSIVQVHGVSDAGETGDLVDIQVVLAQGNRIARGGVGTLGDTWQANLPVADPDNAALKFEDGAAIAFGLETHSENLRTITWAQPMRINKVA
jgi:hypothetical protein